MIEVVLISLFPEVFEGALKTSILLRAQRMKRLKVKLINLRDYCPGRHQTADDRPYGGGPGMVLKAEPILRALKTAGRAHRVLLSPRGKRLDQKSLKRLSQKKRLVLVCGHYAGVDERVGRFMDEEISIGDYVLTGGEIPALVLLDGVSRLQKGVLGNSDSLPQDSFSSYWGGLLSAPLFTRPERLSGFSVPKTLLAGNHLLIRKWRRRTAEATTRARRPDLSK